MKERIKKYRLRFELTQSQLAEKLEVTQDYISMLERGIRRPSLMTAKKMADVFQSTVDEVFFK